MTDFEGHAKRSTLNPAVFLEFPDPEVVVQGRLHKKYHLTWVLTSETLQFKSLTKFIKK